jgi:nucleoside-diphosphate-sugar epimerase
MKRVLVTGGAGYIGSVLTHKLLELGHQVVVLDNLYYTDIGIRDLRQHASLNIVAADIRDLPALRRSLEGIDCVIHLAALANDPSAELNLDLTRQINLETYPIILEEAVKAGVSRFINISSIAVYGINYDNNATEADALNPLTEYAACKAKGEEIVRRCNSDSFTTVSLRCGTVCGWSPRMRFDLSTNTLAAYAIANRQLAIWGGDQKRPQIHIDDITDIVISLLAIPAEKVGGKLFNAAGSNTTVSEIAETIQAVMGGELILTNAPARNDERTYHVSSDKIARELGLTTRKTIRDAVVDIKKAYESGLWSNPDDPLYHNVKRMRLMENSH